MRMSAKSQMTMYVTSVSGKRRWVATKRMPPAMAGNVSANQFPYAVGWTAESASAAAPEASKTEGNFTGSTILRRGAAGYCFCAVHVPDCLSDGNPGTTYVHEIEPLADPPTAVPCAKHCVW